MKIETWPFYDFFDFYDFLGGRDSQNRKQAKAPAQIKSGSQKLFHWRYYYWWMYGKYRISNVLCTVSMIVEKQHSFTEYVVLWEINRKIRYAKTRGELSNIHVC